MSANLRKVQCFRAAILILILIVEWAQAGPGGGAPDGGVASAGPTALQGIPWVDGFETGLEASHEARRPVLVYFQARWCSWCHVFERDILGHPLVQRSILQHYVPALVNYDARPELFRRLGGRGLPYTVILSPGGDLLARLPGILSAEDTIAALEGIATTGDWQWHSVEPSGTHITRLDAEAYQSFRRAYLEHLESLYEADTGTFTGYLESGAGIKRPAPLAWLYITERGLWPQRSRTAARMARMRLYDEVDGGWFYFRDPHRADEHLETSKLLDANAWLACWMAVAGKRYGDPSLIRTAEETVRYLRRLLWDVSAGGFWQAQIADPAYYGSAPQERKGRAAPPVDRIKRTDSNAQAAWALMKIGDLLGDAQSHELAAATLDHILQAQLRGDRLYHAWQAGRGQGVAFNLPRDLFWVLAAGHKVQGARFDDQRRERLRVVLRLAVDWLKQNMRETSADELPGELLGLVAWVTVSTQEWAWPEGATQWALRGVRIEPGTLPQEPVFALVAWEQLLEYDRVRASQAGTY